MDKVTYRSNNLPRHEVKKDFAPVLFGNWAAKFVFLSVSAFLVYNVAHSVNITTQKVDILKNARQEVEKLRVTNLELDTQLQNMQSSQYIEVEARDRLNYSGSGETSFVISDELMATAKERLDGILNEKTTDERANWQKWGVVIVNGI